MDNREKWMKYALIAISTFLGAFLAFYFVADQVAKRMFIHHMPLHMRHMMAPIEKMDRKMEKVVRNEERAMENFDMPEMPMAKDPAILKNYSTEDEYKIILDLSKFNDNPENVKVNIQDNRVNISGKSTIKKFGKTGEYEFEQNFVLPHDINKAYVTKIKKGHKYIITLPFED